ncbi:ribosome small subunit-dependent GTPase A [Pelagicoccus sp. NFK12]|uniref:Small ribosomal subunit biogenesis GTPase RsgA n=1 Tax=Pelagicoccus enzymogenes TaxID=2773457 RepID=A0A927FCA9_9BACT|nr:ribosome small subunit-dependent GTPase A [Pelagicoccus enzymogenes]MBD5781721.1 ribosome small subunit-dependent GTPase A [Pelagicoccus enzymogenes]
MNIGLEGLGWNEWFQKEFDAVDDGTLTPARVIRENRGEYVVSTGDATAIARLPGVERLGKMDSAAYPTVGDWLALEKVENGEDFLVRSFLARYSLFERKVVGDATRHQSIVANFDSLFLVTGLDLDFNTARIQRYLSLAWNSRRELVIVLNKADLRDDLPEILEAVREVAGEVPVHAVSAHDRSTLDCLFEYLGKGKTVALLGSSGVGKSSLVNAFLGEDKLLTQQNRAADGRGRHTTTWRELQAIPTGGVLIDLPGMRELQLTGEGDGVDKTFEDVEALMLECKFRNCRHEGEPGCAIDAAIKDGRLAASRYEQFLKLSQEHAIAKARREARDKAIAARRRQVNVKEGVAKKGKTRRQKNANRSRDLIDGAND